MQRWEYLFVDVARTGEVYSVNGQTVVHQKWLRYVYANQLGSQGWELVGTVSSESSTYQLIFKRPKL
jgi:hypothetical protein